MNIEERISQLAGSHALEQEGMGDQHDEVVQLIKDVLEYVKPSKATIDSMRYEMALSLGEGMEEAVDMIGENQKELGL